MTKFETVEVDGGVTRGPPQGERDSVDKKRASPRSTYHIDRGTLLGRTVNRGVLSTVCIQVSTVTASVEVSVVDTFASWPMLQFSPCIEDFSFSGFGSWMNFKAFLKFCRLRLSRFRLAVDVPRNRLTFLGLANPSLFTRCLL